MRIFMAPMEGVIDHHMRKLLPSIGGIDMSVTEFIRVTDHLLPPKVFYKYCPELLNTSGTDVNKQQIPVRIQLLGSNASALADNAKRAATLGACGIDLNFGCPAKTVNRHRGGACLLDDTDSIYRIVAAVRAAVPMAIPVTAKIRLGYTDRLSYLRNSEAIEAAGASELFVHARSKTDGYKPPAYWSYIGEINEKLKIPVIANGEIWTFEDYEQCRRESGCEDFMLGRGLLADPGLARKIKASHEGQTPKEMSWSETVPLLLALYRETSTAYPAKFIGNRAKQWLHYLKRHYCEANKLFDEIKRSRDYDEMDRAIQQSHCG